MHKSNTHNKIAIDGPSALVFYRDRDVARNQGKPFYAQPVHAAPEVNMAAMEDVDDEDFCLSDDDMAMMLAESHVFGGLPKTSRRDTEDEKAGLAPLKRTRIRNIEDCSVRSLDVKSIPFASLGLRRPSEDVPLYLLSPNVQGRRRVNNVRVRSCSAELPSDAFWQLGDRVLVPKPEFTFLLLAKYLDLANLIMVGMELCGYYRLGGTSSNALFASKSTMYGCQPLTSSVLLARFLERAKGFPGAKKAARACRYLEQGAASPMESVLYLLLCLPPMLGGYGLVRPILNGKRAVNREAKVFTMSEYLIPDLYWPAAKLDVEYDSEAFHADRLSLRNGAKRTLALRAMHVEVVSLTSEIVYDDDSLDVVARLIGHRLGKRLPAKSNDTFSARKDALRETILT